MRRFFDSRGIGGRQDALLTEEAAQCHESDEDMDISAAYGKAENKGWGRKRRRALLKGVGAK